LRVDRVKPREREGTSERHRKECPPSNHTPLDRKRSNVTKDWQDSKRIKFDDEIRKRKASECRGGVKKRKHCIGKRWGGSFTAAQEKRDPIPEGKAEGDPRRRKSRERDGGTRESKKEQKSSLQP